jgi:hypothetical protein
MLMRQRRRRNRELALDAGISPFSTVTGDDVTDKILS